MSAAEIANGASRLARLIEVRAELAALQVEIEALPPFYGKFFAENGLRQAQIHVADCQRLLGPDGLGESTDPEVRRERASG